MQKNFSQKEIQAIGVIRNSLMDSGQTPSVRDLMRELGYKSPRSASVIIDTLLSKGVLQKRGDGSMQLSDFKLEGLDNEQTVKIPLVGSASCGLPLFAEENIEGFIPVSLKLIKPSEKYFLLRANGDSMNLAGIQLGNLVLVRKQVTAQNGDKVVALIDDEATIKIFQHNGDTVVLKPKSDNPNHQPIILTNDFKIQGVVIATIPV
ncbi:MAG: repressor LexA [Flavobacteriales bacterium]|jgi:repressor LexA